MNLRAMASGVTQVVVPKVQLIVRVSRGTTQDASFKTVPSYAPPVKVMGDVQPVMFRDIQQMDGLNLQGTRRRIYLYGKIDGLVRVKNKGGDLITDPDGNVWLVAVVAEQWPTWVVCLVTLQTDGRV